MPRIVPRSEWGARYPNGAKVRLPWSLVVIHTEAGAIRDEDWPAIIEAAQAGLSPNEKAHTRNLESYVAGTRGFGQFAYSFLIFEDGTIVEGCGWGHRGYATEGHNSDSASICFTGHGDRKAATGAQWAAARWLIGEGVRLGHLTPNPAVEPHSKYSQGGKSCPGTLNTPHLDRLRGVTGPVTPNPEEPTVKEIDELKAMSAEQREFILSLNRKVDALANQVTTLRGQVKEDFKAQLITLDEQRKSGKKG